MVQSPTQLLRFLVESRRRFAAARPRNCGAGLGAIAAAVLVASCAPGDTHGEGCKQRFQETCQCPDGKPGQRGCVDGKLGECQCAAVAAPVTDAGLAGDFGNSDAGPPRLLPDASPAGQSDAGDIVVDTMCGEQESQAVIGDERPVDVIFIIDNSGSMSDEIAAVERNINQNFAQIIAASGADYRVIMLTDHGADSLSVCVEPPLAATPCTDSASPAGSTMGAPANGERFFHYDINVQSWDSVCLMMSHYLIDPMLGPLPQTGAMAAPTGWNEFLRPEALKVFVEITDDQLNCSTSTAPVQSFAPMGTTAADATRLAREVYRAILNLSAAHFGTAEAPKFIWHSIVGIVDNDPIELPFTHFDPPEIAGRCSTAQNPGTAYQMLSISTAGLRYPVCAADDGHGYDAVFRAIAHEVVRGSRVECAFNIPEPPPGKFVDYESVLVEYTPGSGAARQPFGRVKRADCNDHSFYFEDSQIKLCPTTCERVRADELANISVVFGCGPQVILDPDIL
jgi:hypothetical protein